MDFLGVVDVIVLDLAHLWKQIGALELFFHAK